MRPRTAAAALLVALAALALARAEHPEEPPGRPPRTYAVLINGGQSADKNYLSHLHHLQDMVAEIERRGVEREWIAVFCSDGGKPGSDLAARELAPEAAWLLEGTPIGRKLLEPSLTDTVWPEVTLRPARTAELRRWFSAMQGEIRPGDTLLVFVTDHGSKDPDDPSTAVIALWDESLSVLEFRALLAHLDPGVRVVQVMSQCHAGAFADSMSPFRIAEPTGDVCGFYSTTRDRLAYGCFPEGRDRDRLGHAFRFIDALGRHADADSAHREVLLTDTSPDVPVRTSDLYLRRILEEEARTRGLEPDALVDEQLALAWTDRGRWEPHIRLLDRLGGIYGVFSPRLLTEIESRREDLQTLASELDTYGDRWKLALDDLRRDNLREFLERDPEWKETLDAKNLDALSPAVRKATRDRLLPAFETFTREREDVWKRLEKLHGAYTQAGAAKWRVQVRLAALLRMRVLLTRVAGMELVRGRTTSKGAPGEAARALAALEACESGTIGEFPGAATPPATPEPLASFEEDLASVREVLPSWLGIRFRTVPPARQERPGMEGGAVMVQQVYPDSPALAAGLRPGDIVLGPPGAHFDEPRRIVEWTMTSPRDTPLPLDVLREDRTVGLSVSLGSYPTKLPGLPDPPGAGDPAPPLGSMQFVRSPEEPPSGFVGRRHVLFFWATWCGPCKDSLPELLEWSRESGVPIVAISDEEEETLRGFLDKWSDGFPETVASDAFRVSFVAYAVSGTPTFVLVDEQDRIEWRQVGYSRERGLGLPDWSWSREQP